MAFGGSIGQVFIFLFFFSLGEVTRVGVNLGRLGNECNQGALCETLK